MNKANDVRGKKILEILQLLVGMSYLDAVAVLECAKLRIAANLTSKLEETSEEDKEN